MEGGEKTEMDLRWRRGRSGGGGGGKERERARERMGDRQNHRQTDGVVRKLTEREFLKEIGCKESEKGCKETEKAHRKG